MRGYASEGGAGDSCLHRKEIGPPLISIPCYVFYLAEESLYLFRLGSGPGFNLLYTFIKEMPLNKPKEAL